MIRSLLVTGFIAACASASLITVGSPQTQAMDPFCAS